jgi:hypothetical protein
MACPENRFPELWNKTRKEIPPMEELQIQTFVHRVSTDSGLREELRRDPKGVILREGFSPRVSRIVSRLVPHLTLDEPIETSYGSRWWQY